MSKRAGKRQGSGNLRGRGRLNCAFESEYNDVMLHYLRGRRTIKRTKTSSEDFKNLIMRVKNENKNNKTY